MKKLRLILAVVLFGTMAASCQRNAAEEQGTPENPYTIVWYNIGTPQEDMDKVFEKVNEYTREKIGVVLEMKMVGYGDYNKVMNLKSSSGDKYDLCFTGTWANNYYLAAQKGYLTPLNELLEEYGQGIIKKLGSKLDEGKINGEVYAIPVRKEAAFQKVLRFNKRYVDKYNFDLSKVKSLKDIKPMLEVIKENEPNVIGFYSPQYYPFEKYYVYRYAPLFPGAIKLQEEGKPPVINQFENEDFLDIIKIYNEYFKDGYIPQDLVVDGVDDASVMSSGNWFCDIQDACPYADISWNNNLRTNGYSIVSVPLFTPPVRKILDCMIGVSITAERPDLDMKFLNLLNTDKYLRNLLQYGIEGVHYEKIGENRIKYLPRHAKYGQATFSLGDMLMLYLIGNDPEDKWEKYEEWNEEAMVPTILGFEFNEAPVKTEVTSINNIVSKYGKIVYLSPDGIKNLDKMQKELKAAGMDKVMVEMQRQLDEWWKKNKENN